MSIQPVPRKIKFAYIKGNFFRTARAHGAWAGTNGFSDLVLSFYSERTPIPRETVHPILADDVLGEEIVSERKVRNQIVREVEFSVSMSLEVARSLKDLLAKQIDALESIKSQAQKNKPKK